jgi:hypothetical protein
MSPLFGGISATWIPNELRPSDARTRTNRPPKAASISSSLRTVYSRASVVSFVIPPWSTKASSSGPERLSNVGGSARCRRPSSLAGDNPRLPAEWREWAILADVAVRLLTYDDSADGVLAEAHTGPLAWNGQLAELPDGTDDALRSVVAARRADGAVDTLCAFAAEVSPTARQRGVAGRLLQGMRELAMRHGLHRLIAPVRPSWTERYPLAPIERYVTWRREDGQLLDPWMRLHERLGARVATALPHSMRITGTVHEWQTWTGLAFPESGAYVFPHGLAPVDIDRDADLGTYWEPNVWMIHPDVP